MTKFTLLLVFCWGFLMLFADAPGKIEGNIFPVIENFEYTSSDRGIIYGSFDKVRSCTFERIRWYIQDEPSLDKSKVIVYFIGSEKIRPSGAEVFGPWMIKSDGDTITNRSTIFVEHRCHPFWMTETRVK